MSDSEPGQEKTPRPSLTPNQRSLALTTQIYDLVELLDEGDLDSAQRVGVQERILQLERERTKLLREPNPFKRAFLRFSRRRT